VTAGVSKVSHLLLQVSDLDRSLRFYVDFLGFTVRESSTLKDGRAFHATVEGLGLTTLPEGVARASSFDHLAFRCPDGIEPLRAMLDQAGIAYEARRSPYGNSLYFRDPDGYLLELHDSTGI
jgi:catechol 2,3-dioxygenase-like lactoylglutathione lyase family enzyme